MREISLDGLITPCSRIAIARGNVFIPTYAP